MLWGAPIRGQSRSPLGLRELKLVDKTARHFDIGRSPLGLRELKRYTLNMPRAAQGRSPLGLRELKLTTQAEASGASPSQPAWAA